MAASGCWDLLTRKEIREREARERSFAEQERVRLQNLNNSDLVNELSYSQNNDYGLSQTLLDEVTRRLCGEN